MIYTYWMLLRKMLYMDHLTYINIISKVYCTTFLKCMALRLYNKRNISVCALTFLNGSYIIRRTFLKTIPSLKYRLFHFYILPYMYNVLDYTHFQHLGFLDAVLDIITYFHSCNLHLIHFYWD